MMRRIVNAITNHTTAFFMITFLLWITTATMLKTAHSLNIYDSITLSTGFLLGDSPLSRNEVSLGKFDVWLCYALRFTGWLIIPVLVGIVIEKESKKNREEQEKLLKDEHRIQEAEEKTLVTLEKKLTNVGIDKQLAVDVLDTLKNELTENFKKKKTETLY